jgi:ASC-1-like (ASCH) protein
MLEKIKSGQKTIESRWYMRRFDPWNNIKTGETVYFKEAGKDVCLRAKVVKVEQFDNLTPAIVKLILKRYRKELGIDRVDTDYFYKLFKDKRYCILIYLKRPKRIKPFKLNKAGLGSMSAWICLRALKVIKL